MNRARTYSKIYWKTAYVEKSDNNLTTNENPDEEFYRIKSKHKLPMHVCEV